MDLRSGEIIREHQEILRRMMDGDVIAPISEEDAEAAMRDDLERERVRNRAIQGMRAKLDSFQHRRDGYMLDKKRR